MASRRATNEALAGHVELPQRLWGRIIPFLFVCCLFVFLHALLGFGIPEDRLNALNHTLAYSRTPQFDSPLWRQTSAWSNENRRILDWGMARMVADWQRNYELPSTTTGPVMIPRDAFPNPTPALFRTGPGSAETSADVAFWLGFTGTVGGDENHWRHLVAARPRAGSQRKRRFGRCLPEEVCL